MVQCARRQVLDTANRGSNAPRSRKFASAALAIGIAAFVACDPAFADGLLSQTCFTAADNARLGFEVYQQAPPPSRQSRAYAYYPLTAAVSSQLRALGAAPDGVQSWYYQWANRASTPLTGDGGRAIVRKLNIQPSSSGKRRQRSAFSTIERADACTLAQAASLLGRDARGRTIAISAGITLTGEAATPETDRATPIDTCLTANGMLPARASGIVLDYEVQDGRNPAMTEQFLKAYADLVHDADRRVILLVNPLDSPGEQRFTGVVAANASRIVALFDRTMLVLWSGNVHHSLADSYAAQMAILRAGGPIDTRRVLIDFELAGTTLEDAQLVRKLIARDRLAGVLFWRNHAAQGGDCDSAVNRRIATIALGSDMKAKHSAP